MLIMLFGEVSHQMERCSYPLDKKIASFGMSQTGPRFFMLKKRLILFSVPGNNLWE
jgi:hypothetical protein